MKILHVTDCHFRERAPRCRTDDWINTIIKKFEFVLEQRKKYRAILCITGDFFDINPASPSMERLIIKMMKCHDCNADNTLAVLGQHDLGKRSLDSINKTSMAVLEAAGLLRILRADNAYNYAIDKMRFSFWGASWGQEVPTPECDGRINILLIHETIATEPLFPGHVPIYANMFLRRKKNYQLILSGDNHKRFIRKYQGRILVNGGSLLRLTADQKDHVPIITLFEVNDEISYEEIIVPHEDNVIDRTHIERHREEQNLRELIRQMNQGRIDIHFKQNLIRYCRDNNVAYDVKDILIDALPE